MALPARQLEQSESFHRARAPRRRARRKRGNAAFRLRVGLVSGLLLAAVLAYVGMTAELTAQTYRLSADQTHHAELAQSTDALAQRLAQMQSLPRLEIAAARLHMAQPQRVVVIALPTIARVRPPMTFAARLSNLTKWLKRE